jgi:copper resistance protein D
VTLLIDLFGYLSIVIHGFTIATQSMALGSVLFIALALRPVASRLGSAGRDLEGICIRAAVWSAVALVISEIISVILQVTVLVGTVDLSIVNALHADFAIAAMLKIAAAALIALTLYALRQRAPIAALLALAVIELAGATLTTHAAARLDYRTPLLLVEGLHQLGAAIWIGGIPACPEPADMAADRFTFLAYVDGGCRLYPAERDHDEHPVYRRLVGFLWHCLRRDGRGQDRHVPHAARPWCR